MAKSRESQEPQIKSALKPQLVEETLVVAAHPKTLNLWTLSSPNVSVKIKNTLKSAKIKDLRVISRLTVSWTSQK